MDRITTKNPLRIKLDIGYEEAVKRVKQALQEQGFGILTEIDVKETLRKKMGAEMEPYVILGACNPPLAHKAIQANPEIGLFLPCNVIVYVEQDHTIVSIIDPLSMLEMAHTPELEPVARDAHARLQRAAEVIAQKAP